MQQIDFSSFLRWFCFLALAVALTGMHQSYAYHSPFKINPIEVDPTDVVQETMIRIAGTIIEESSQRPVKNANVMVRGGDLALASKKTDDEGKFEFYIPAKKIASLQIGLRINYMNQIFSKEDISPISQEILIYINGAVLLEENPMAEYSLPIHMLDDPKIGQVMIRF